MRADKDGKARILSGQLDIDCIRLPDLMASPGLRRPAQPAIWPGEALPQ